MESVLLNRRSEQDGRPASRSVGALIATAAVVAAASVFAYVGWTASRSDTVAGFWYERDAFALPGDAEARLGGTLTSDEIASIEKLSRMELERAFAGSRIDFSDKPEGVWRVEVVRRLGPWDGLTRARALPAAGRSLAFGPLGGRGSVAFDVVAGNAIQLAAAGASRQRMIDGIGRGIGRTAAHEFAHQILGSAMVDGDDEHGYEYGSATSFAWYYGELRWATVGTLLAREVGRE